MPEIKASITMKIEDGASEKIAAAIEKWTKENMYMVVVDSPYATMVENGTNPAEHTAGGGSDTYKSILQWVIKRNIGTNNQSDKQVAYNIYKHIMKCGMVPHPFVKPSIVRYFSKENLFEDSNIDMRKKEPFKAIMTGLAAEIKNTIARENLLYSGNLLNSVKVIPVKDVHPIKALEVSEIEQISRRNSEKVNCVTGKRVVSGRGRKTVRNNGVKVTAYGKGTGSFRRVK